jgi:hypothetical protein
MIHLALRAFAPSGISGKGRVGEPRKERAKDNHGQWGDGRKRS